MARPKKKAEKRRADGRIVYNPVVGKTFDGKILRKCFYSRISMADCHRQFEEYKIKQGIANILGEVVTTSNQNFEDWAKKVLLSLKGTVKDNSYQLTYRNSIENHLIPYFKKADLKSIKQINIQEYFNAKGKSLTIETLKKHKNCLNKIFSSAVANEIIVKNPCFDIKLNSKIDSAKKNVYTAEQYALVFAYTDIHRYGTEVLLLLEYGLSRSELLGIQWQDIDFENKVLCIKRGVASVQDAETNKMRIEVGEPKTNFRKREIPLSSAVIEKLSQLTQKCEFVFCTKNNTPHSPTTWSKRHFEIFMRDMHEYYLKQEPSIDVPILNPHELRHTRASLWVNSGANLFAISEVMGWADLKMLRKRYGHAEVESNRKMLGID